MSKAKLGRRELQLFLWPLLLLSWPLFGLLRNKQVIPRWLQPGYTRENGRSYSCQTNLKQINLAMSQYLKDYDQNFPLKVSAGLTVPGLPTRDARGGIISFSGNPVGWADSLMPYLKGESLFFCPNTG